MRLTEDAERCRNDRALDELVYLVVGNAAGRSNSMHLIEGIVR